MKRCRIFSSNAGHSNARGGYSHCGLTGGPVSAKEGQSKNFEKYRQMVVSFYKNPHMVVHEPENWVIW